MQYRSWLVVTFLVRRLPLRASYAIATVAGWAGYYCWPRGRRAMHRNYLRVLRGQPRPHIRRVARQSMVNYCRYLVDFIRYGSLSAQEVARMVDGDGHFEALDAVLARGKGAVIAVMHFGNWDYGATAAAAHGVPVFSIAETFQDPRLDEAVVSSRERAGIKLLKLESLGPSLYRCLSQNAVLALLIDRPTPGQGVRVRFFDEEISVPSGPARIALRTGAGVVAAAFPRIAPWQPAIRVVADFSIEIERTDDFERDVQALTQEMFSAQERIIRSWPDQWYMFREMWRPPARRAVNRASAPAAAAGG